MFHDNNVHEDTRDELAGLLDPQAGSGNLRKVVAIGCCLNVLLFFLKVGGGWLGHSDALMADGFHSLGDFSMDIVMFLFLGISLRKATKEYSYGYGKFETFASLIASMIVGAIGITLIIEGAERIAAYSRGEVLARPDIWTLGVILLAMFVKEGLYHFYDNSGRKLKSSALRAIALHHRTDAFASIATLIGVGCSIFFGEKLRILDPIVTLVLSALIVASSIRIFLPAYRELLDKALPKEVADQAESIIVASPGVKGISYLRSRRNGRYFIFDAGILVDPDISIRSGREIAMEIEKRLSEKFRNPLMVSITIEPSPSAINRHSSAT